MVSNTRELLPEPETPVNTVSLRFGISTLTSRRLFSRAPCTRIQSWLSPAWGCGSGSGDCVCGIVAVLIVSPSGSGGPPLVREYDNSQPENVTQGTEMGGRRGGGDRSQERAVGGEPSPSPCPDQAVTVETSGSRTLKRVSPGTEVTSM